MGIEDDVLHWHNICRTNPQEMIDELEKRLQYFQGNVYQAPGQEVGLRTNEGPPAIQECIDFMKENPKSTPLSLSHGLTKAADDHVKDCGPKGINGHDGSDGSSMSERMERYGDWKTGCSENISYASKTGLDIVLQLIVDDGVSSRGHRKNIFKPETTVCGIAHGDHKEWGTMTCIDYANGYEEKEQKPTNTEKEQKPTNTGKEQNSTNSGNESVKPSKSACACILF